MLVDDDGNARLTIATLGTTGPWPLSVKDCSYMAPETRPPPDPSTIADSPRMPGSVTVVSDVYEMAIVIYEVSSIHIGRLKGQVLSTS